MTLEKLFNISVWEGECLICPLTPSKIYPWIGGASTAGRFMWEAKKGPIPKGLYVLHKCDVPRCINIEHLFLGTKTDNMIDKVAKGRQSRGKRPRWVGLTDFPEIVTMRYAGKTFEEIGKRFHCSRRTIKRLLEDCPHD